ncbi:MAG TPA: hypothetical protein VD770_03575, partial [Coxiellaceae bacterium]|nr:hypothetical protein [Coxiellaceae bacterium]
AVWLVGFGVSVSSLAATYTLYATNKTQDMFTLKQGLSTVGSLDAKEKIKKFEFDEDDSVLFISDTLPRLTVKYDQTNQRPECFDLFQGYTCDFTKFLGTENFLLTIDKND